MQRVDNLITELKKYAEHLLIHVKVVSEAKNRLWWFQLQLWLILLLFTFVGGTVIYRLTFDPVLSFAPLVILIVGYFAINKIVAKREKSIVDNLFIIFEKMYSQDLVSDKKDNLLRVWEEVHPVIKFTVERTSLLSFSTVRKSELSLLENIIRTKVPALLDLRRKIKV